MKLLRGKPFAIKLVYYQNSQFVFKIFVIKYWFNKVSRTCIKIWEYSINIHLFRTKIAVPGFLVSLNKDRRDFIIVENAKSWGDLVLA